MWKEQLWGINPCFSCQHQGKGTPPISHVSREEKYHLGGQPRECLLLTGQEQKMPLVDFFCETCAKPWLVGWWDQVIWRYLGFVCFVSVDRHSWEGGMHELLDSQPLIWFHWLGEIDQGEPRGSLTSAAYLILLRGHRTCLVLQASLYKHASWQDGHNQFRVLLATVCGALWQSGETREDRCPSWQPTMSDCRVPCPVAKQTGSLLSPVLPDLQATEEDPHIGCPLSNTITIFEYCLD